MADEEEPVEEGEGEEGGEGGGAARRKQEKGLFGNLAGRAGKRGESKADALMAKAPNERPREFEGTMFIRGMENVSNENLNFFFTISIQHSNKKRKARIKLVIRYIERGLPPVRRFQRAKTR